MSGKQTFTTEQAHETGNKLGIDWSRFDMSRLLNTTVIMVAKLAT
jgi:hypothetical protein